MVLLTPFSQGTLLLSVGLLIVVGDQAYHRCVIGKFDDDVGAVCGCTVVCVRGVQEWAEDAALRSTRECISGLIYFRFVFLDIKIICSLFLKQRCTLCDREMNH